MTIFAWNIPLVSLIFLKRSLVFPILLFSSISLHGLLRKAFLSLLPIFFFKFYFIFKLYIIVLVLPFKMNPPQIYTCSQFWIHTNPVLITLCIFCLIRFRYSLGKYLLKKKKKRLFQKYNTVLCLLPFQFPVFSPSLRIDMAFHNSLFMWSKIGTQVNEQKSDMLYSYQE